MNSSTDGVRPTRGKRNFMELRLQASEPTTEQPIAQETGGFSSANIITANTTTGTCTATSSTPCHAPLSLPQTASCIPGSATLASIAVNTAVPPLTSKKTNPVAETYTDTTLDDNLIAATIARAPASGLMESHIGFSSLGSQSPLVAADFEIIRELGEGNGGAVRLVRHRPTDRLMAMKGLFFAGGSTHNTNGMKPTDSQFEKNEEDTIKRQVVRELQILQTCNNEYIVSYYGAFINEREVSVCMEFMNLGSLDKLYRKIGRFEEEVVGRITVSVLEGLVYLYLNYRIIHRDVKPNNILVNSQGQLKLCDFGVSAEAINSVVKTFVGTSGYMSPERITGKPYSVQSDVWSLGITLLEIAVGRFPFPPEGEEVNLSVFELLDFIVNEKSPRLPVGMFSSSFQDFLDSCLIKDPITRPTPARLMLHEFVKCAKQSPVDMGAWAKRIHSTITASAVKH